MAVKILYPSDFKEMPWKNGGGSTTELFRVPKDQDFMFRISKAHLQNDGAFSIYPNIDRIIFLDGGNGFNLKGPNVDVTLVDSHTMFHFRGEEIIECNLIDGPCLDFNIMTDRRFAKARATLSQLESNVSATFTSENDLTIIYDKEDNKLYKLELKDSCTFTPAADKNLYVISVDFIT